MSSWKSLKSLGSKAWNTLKSEPVVKSWNMVKNVAKKIDKLEPVQKVLDEGRKNIPYFEKGEKYLRKGLGTADRAINSGDQSFQEFVGNEASNYNTLTPEDNKKIVNKSFKIINKAGGKIGSVIDKYKR
jgi:hypothetical protein